MDSLIKWLCAASVALAGAAVAMMVFSDATALPLAGMVCGTAASVPVSVALLHGLGRM